MHDLFYLPKLLIGLFFTLFPLLFGAAFVYAIVRIVQANAWNNAQPVLTIPVRLAFKDASTFGEANDYSLIFEAHNGECRKFSVSRSEYRQRVVGEYGMITFQGTRYKGFVPSVPTSSAPASFPAAPPR